MKNLFTGDLSNIRDVKGRIAVYDERIIFGEQLPSIEAPFPTFYFPMWFHVDTADGYIYTYYGDMNMNKIYYARRTDEMEVPVLQDTGIACAQMSPHGFFGDTCFYLNTGYSFVKNKYPYNNQTLLVQPNLDFASGVTALRMNSKIAGVSDDEAFIMSHHWVGPEGKCNIKIVKISSTHTNAWEGRIYDIKNDFGGPFYAIKHNGKNYLYFSDTSTFRTYYLVEDENGRFSELKQVLPLDTLDDASSFLMSSASLIDDKVVVCGCLRRQNADKDLMVYLIGPENFTFGRDMFIGLPYEDGMPRRDFNARLLKHNNKLIFQGANYKYIGNISKLLGDNTITFVDGLSLPSTGKHIEGVLNMTIGTGISAPGTAQIEISPNSVDESISLLRPGTVIKPEIYIKDGNINKWMSLGEYEIDGTIDPFEESERTITLSLRQKAIRRLSQWTCDAPYDFWSQTKLTANPKDLKDVIRVTGTWDDNGEDLKITNLNEDNYFYVNARADKNTDMEAIFNLYEYTNSNSCMGVCVNFFTETRAQAAERTSVDVSQITSNDLVKYSVMLEYYPKSNTAYLKYVGGANTEILQTFTNLPAPGERAMLRIIFIDGYIRCYLKTNYNYIDYLHLDSCLIYSGSFYSPNDNLPWRRAELVEGDELGRGAVFMRANTEYGKVYPFTSTDKYIPVQGNPFTKSSATVKVGSEIIQYTNKTNRTPFTTKLDYAVGIPLASFDGTIGTNQQFADMRSRNYIRQEFVIPDAKYTTNSTYCTGIAIKAKKNFYPQDGLNVMLYDRDISSNNPLGRRKASKIIPSENIEEDMGWIVAEFRNPVAISKTNDHIIVCRGEDANNPNSQAFYTAGLVNGNQYGSGRFFTFSDDTDQFTQISDRDMPFIIYGTYDPPGGNYVIRVNKITGLSATTDYYKNMALYVTDGPGKGQTFFIRGYVYGAEVCTFYLDRNPSVLSLGSKFIIVNTLYGVTRADPIAHRLDEKVDLYYPGPYVGCEKVNYFTTKQDKKISDITRYICRKAGVLGFSERYLVDQDVIPANNVTLSEDLRNVIMEVVVPFDMNGKAHLNFRSNTVSLVFDQPDIGSVSTSLHIDGVMYRTVTLDKIYDIPITISLNDNFLSLWASGKYLISFPIPETDTSLRTLSVSGSSTYPIHVKISELSYRIDNFLLDIGTNGLQLLDRLINNKIYYFLDDGDGGIKMFRSRTEVNTEQNPYTLAIAAGRTDTDVSVFSRIRVEGAEVKEAIDLDLLREYGNIYKTVNIDEINNVDDAEYFSSALIDDAKDKAEIISLVGTADPRLEPMDIIYTRILKRDGGFEDKKVIIDDITLRFSNESETQFDMNITGRVDR